MTAGFSPKNRNGIVLDRRSTGHEAQRTGAPGVVFGRMNLFLVQPRAKNRTTMSESAESAEITALFREVRAGKEGASEKLVPLVYERLRRIAARQFDEKSPGPTLHPTVIVHEAWERLAFGAAADVENRRHFYRLAARIMRDLIVDHLRRRSALRRGGEKRRIELADDVAAIDADSSMVLELNEALEELEVLHERQARVVEMHFYGGLEFQEIADALSVSLPTVIRDWRSARTWLGLRLGKAGA